MLTVKQIKDNARSALNSKMGDALTITMHAITNRGSRRWGRT